MVTSPYAQNSYVSLDQAHLKWPYAQPKPPKDNQLLIGFLVFQGFKPITLELKSRRGGGFHGSSLPNHDAKGWKGKEKQKQRKYQGQTALE